MKNRQIRLIIGILAGLVLFSSSLAFLLYTKQNVNVADNKDSVEVFIASKHLKKGDFINIADIEKAYISKSYLSNVPLTQSEIIGRYAAVEIFPKEPLRSEKISMTKIQEVETVDLLGSKDMELIEEKLSQDNDTVTLPLSLFQNLDTSLKSGDYIDIVSIVQKKSQSKTAEFDTKYIALHILVNSFVSHANKTQSVISEVDGKLLEADSVVFEMTPSEIKNFFAVYYQTQELNANRVFNTSKISKGHLWMVKCSTIVDESTQKSKERLMINRVFQKRKRVKNTANVSISYEN